MTFALFILNYITVIQLKALNNTPEILAIPILLSKLGIKQFPDRRLFFSSNINRRQRTSTHNTFVLKPTSCLIMSSNLSTYPGDRREHR